MSSVEIAAAAVVTEYTLRLRNAVAKARTAQADLRDSGGQLPAERIESLMDSILQARQLAERGFRLDLLADVPDAMGVWLAAEAIIIYHEVVDGMVFQCATIRGCSAARLCAMNNLIDRRVADGYKHTTGAALHIPIPRQAVADGCTKMQPRVIAEDDPVMATSSRWTGDTASLRAR